MSRCLRCELELPEEIGDPVRVFPRDRLAPGHPVIDVGVVFGQKALELPEFLRAEIRQMSVRESTDQKVGFPRPPMPSAESELAPKRLERPRGVGSKVDGHVVALHIERLMPRVSPGADR